MGEQEHTNSLEGRESPSRRRKRRIVPAATLTGALIAGVLALALPAVAQTTSGGDGAGTDDGSATADTSTPEGETVEDAVKRRLAEALAPLVTGGTITEDQRDSVIEALWTARRSVGADGIPGRHWRGRHGGRQAVASAGELAALLDLTPQELATRLRAGDTLADLAADAGVQGRRHSAGGRWSLRSG